MADPPLLSESLARMELNYLSSPRWGGCLTSDRLPTTVRIELRPPAGSCPVPVPLVVLQASLAADYPSSLAHLTISGEEMALPPPLTRAVDRVLAANQRVGGPGQVRRAAMWLDNHLGELLHELVVLQAEAAARGQAPGEAAQAFEEEEEAFEEEEEEEEGEGEEERAREEEEEAFDLDDTPPAVPVVFAEASDWRVGEQMRLEQALREVFALGAQGGDTLLAYAALPLGCSAAGQGGGIPSARVEARGGQRRDLSSPLDAAPPLSLLLSAPLWAAVAARVGSRSVEECISRFVACRAVAAAWYAGAAAEVRSAAAEAEGAAELASRAAAEEEEAARRRRALRGARIVAERERVEAAGRERAEAELAARAAEADSAVEGERARMAEERAGREAARVRAAAAAGEEEAGGGGGESPTDVAEEAPAEEAGALPPPFEGLHLKPKHSGFQLVVEGLSLWGIGALAVASLRLSAQCTRCRTPSSASLRGAAAAVGGGSGGGGGAPPPALPCEVSSWCAGCSLLQRLALRACLLHEGCPILGYADAEGARVVGLGEACLLASCLECGVTAALPRLALRTPTELNCRACFNRMRVLVSGLEAQPAAAGGREALRTAGAYALSAPAGGRERARFPAGQPLPQAGTCAHYRRSHRWLRFPCCGQAHPCDTCHDEAEDHASEWAQRMLCGFCAREQPYAQGPCVACGKELGTGGGANESFWHGGTGQRQRALLSKNDSRKHGGLAKTHSKKDARVGERPKLARAAAAAAAAAAAKPKGGAGGGGESE